MCRENNQPRSEVSSSTLPCSVLPVCLSIQEPAIEYGRLKTGLVEAMTPLWIGLGDSTFAYAIHGPQIVGSLNTSKSIKSCLCMVLCWCQAGYLIHKSIRRSPDRRADYLNQETKRQNQDRTRPCKTEPASIKPGLNYSSGEMILSSVSLSAK